MIINGNSLEELKKFPDNYFHSVVTDPPYGLSFMGKKWDYSVPSVEIWQEVFRVLKEGGYLLSFAGTRTQHRMAVNIEDAGFEIRDMIAWVYGSGFPKSHNIGKAVDKTGGISISWFGKWLREWRKEEGLSSNDIGKLFPSKTGGLTGCVRNWELGFNIPTNKQFNLICKTYNLPFKNLEEAKREYLGKKTTNKTVYQNIGGDNKSGEIDITKGTSEWEGWGTALKPALEPITMARKPFKGTVANNVLKNGVGGINIDGCRVEGKWNGKTRTNSPDKKQVYGDYKKIKTEQHNLGRFPANFIHDGSDEVKDLFPYSKSVARNKRQCKNPTGVTFMIDKPTGQEHTDSGLASRFFYCAKASKKDREENNNHPTVKPTDLMRYLVRLVTPKNGIVLDCFMGSGSTGKACALEGFEFVGIDLDKDYCEIAQARIDKAIEDKKQDEAQQELF